MNLFNRNKTLKPVKPHKGARSDLSDFAKRTLSTLGSGSMKEAVALPKGEELNEWQEFHTVSRSHKEARQYSYTNSPYEDLNMFVSLG
jgi:hypothetical protein